jgi:hypothetical protein
MRAFLAVTHNERESIAPFPSSHSLREQATVYQANASLMEHESGVSPASPRACRHLER